MDPRIKSAGDARESATRVGAVMRRPIFTLILCALWLIPVGTYADDAPPSHALPADQTTVHRLRLADREIGYKAIAGTLPSNDDKGEHKADLFYVAYLLDGGDAA